MDKGRRDFIKIAGLGAVGAGVGLKFGMDAVAQGPVKTKRKLAMVVDTRKCTGDCPDCIAACHRIHNVPTISNKKHEIKWLWVEGFGGAFPDLQNRHWARGKKPVLVLCNHCDNPPCVRVCPTKATWKRESDGIVMIDMHRCIGCRYCMAGCPYGSRSFNYFDPRKYLKNRDEGFPTRGKGVVEKCNFCAERLQWDGHRLVKGPACVAACEKGALTFGDLKDPNSEVVRLLQSNYTIRRKLSLGTGPEVYYIV